MLSIAVLAVAAVASAQAPDWPSERPPRPLAARQVKFPPYEFRTLPNGLQVIAVSHHEQPAVSLRLIVRAGGAQDPASRPGVAYMAASLLDQGTTTRSAEQIANTIDSIGGAIGSGAGTDLTFINAAVMKDSLALALDLVADLARHPAFAPDEIERQRQQILSGLKVSYDDPDYLAGAVFDRLVYGFHPYGQPDSGTPSSIAGLVREDLRAFHRRWFGANNAILAIVGDVTPEEAFAGAERAFGTWERIDLPERTLVEPPPPVRRVVIIDRPGAVQTEIRVGNIALARKQRDFLALDIASKILGGEGGNRLHKVLRSERGLTYSASADLNALKDTGDIVANTDTRSETTAEALRLIVDEMSKLQRQRVQPRELQDAQEYLTGSFPLTIETPSAIALQVLNAVFYGLDLNELQTYRERVNVITVDDIQRVAQQYLRPDRLSIVLVGDASVFGKQLAGVGFDQAERIPLADLDLSSPDLRRHGAPGGPGRIEPVAIRMDRAVQAAQPAGPPDVKPDVKNDVKELVARAISAKGGLDLLRSIRTIKSVSDVILATPGGAVTVTSTAYVRYPGQFRVDASGPEFTGAGPVRIQTFDSGTAWWVGDAGVAEDAPSIVKTLQAAVQRDTVALLLAMADHRVPARRVADVAFGGKPMPAIEAEMAPAGRVTLVFESGSGLLVYQRYGGEAGGPLTEETFSDYRTVSGLQVAHRASVRREGQPPLQRVVRTFEINLPIEPSFFQKPAASKKSAAKL